MSKTKIMLIPAEKVSDAVRKQVLPTGNAVENSNGTITLTVPEDKVFEYQQRYGALRSMNEG